MCGIFGFIGADQDYSKVREIAQGAARRGPHAHGFAWTQPGGLIDKKFPGPLDVANLEAVQGSQIVVGHCRLATTGVTSFNSLGDAQPLRVGDLVVAHNGVVPPARYRHLIPYMKTKNDSEAIPLAWSKSTLKTPMRAAGAFQDALTQMVKGEAFAVIATDGIALYVARHHLPLHVLTMNGGVYVSSFPFEGSTLLEAGTKDVIKLHVFRCKVAPRLG